MDERTITPSLITEFAAHLTACEKSRATIDKYVRDVNHFAEFSHGQIIERSMVLSYKEQLVKDYAISSANSMLAALNTFFKYMNRADLCVKLFKVQRSVYRNADKELTRSEYIRLVLTARSQGEERLELIIQTICATGIRVSELEYITFEAAVSGEATVSCKGKSRKVFIVSVLRTKLLNYAQANQIHSGPIFITKYGKPMNRTNIWRQMKALCLLADVSTDKVYPHNLRHVFAREFYDIEKDIAKLADILGHSSINTTRLYIMTTGAEHQRKIESMRLVI